MTNHELAEKAINIAQNYKTSYVWGSFGSPINTASITRAINQYPSNNTKRKATLEALTGIEAYMFDCIGLIKGILWGWRGDYYSTYGGASYGSNGVPDTDADTMITRCASVSTDFSNIVVGEVVWLVGHIGIYIGDGKVVESTPSWNDGVQIAYCGNIGKISGLNGRSWTKHGKLPYINYISIEEDEELTQEKFNEMMNTYLAQNTGAACSSWAQEACDKAIENGVVLGDGSGNYKWPLPLTRESFVVMANRMGLLG